MRIFVLTVGNEVWGAYSSYDNAISAFCDYWENDVDIINGYWDYIKECEINPDNMSIRDYIKEIVYPEDSNSYTEEFDLDR